MIKMEIEQIKLDDLRPYENNPRLNAEAVEIGATTNGQKVTEFLYSNKAIKQ